MPYDNKKASMPKMAGGKKPKPVMTKPSDKKMGSKKSC
jgi:hypothetical protein